MNNRELKKQVNKKIRLYRTEQVINFIPSVGIGFTFGMLSGAITDKLTDDIALPLVVTSLSTGVLCIVANKIFTNLSCPVDVTKEDLKVLKQIKKELKDGINNYKDVDCENFNTEVLKHK